MVNRDPFAAVCDGLPGVTAAAIGHPLKRPDQPVKGKPPGVLVFGGVARFFLCGFLCRFCVCFVFGLCSQPSPVFLLRPDLKCLKRYTVFG